MAEFTHVYSSNNWCRLNDHSKTQEFPVCLITWSCTQTFRTREKKRGKTKISLQRINTPFPTELELNTNKCNFAVHACLSSVCSFVIHVGGGCLHFIAGWSPLRISLLFSLTLIYLKYSGPSIDECMTKYDIILQPPLLIFLYIFLSNHNMVFICSNCEPVERSLSYEVGYTFISLFMRINAFDRLYLSRAD